MDELDIRYFDPGAVSWAEMLDTGLDMKSYGVTAEGIQLSSRNEATSSLRRDADRDGAERGTTELAKITFHILGYRIRILSNIRDNLSRDGRRDSVRIR